ncbi:MAG TPA: hypothetical protein VGU74_00445 [Gemmatimonadales bacterium]|nr:hypothetical protein [Gemmatimonadales bacterium]
MLHFKVDIRLRINERRSDGGSANDYCSLDHDPLWLCSDIKSVRSAVKPNSTETCPVEEYRNGLGSSNRIVGAGVAHNATHME